MAVTSLNGLTGVLAVTTPNSTMNVTPSGSNVEIDINLGNANTWTAVQQVVVSTASGQNNGVFWIEQSDTSSSNVGALSLGVNRTSGSLKTPPFIYFYDVASGTANLKARMQLSYTSGSYSSTDSIQFQLANSNSTSSLATVLTLEQSGAVTTANNTLDDGSGNTTTNGIANFNVAGTIQASVWNGSNAGTIIGDPSTANGSGQLYLAASAAVTVRNNCGLISIGGNSGQWEQGPSNGTSTNFMSIALNASATACQSILFNTPVGIPIMTSRYGGSTANTLDDGNNNMTVLGWTWQKGRNYGYFTPTDPTGTTSTSAVMMGLGSTMKLTPAFSGKVRIMFVCGANNSTATAGVTSQLAYGTGTAPSNGAGSSGTTIYPTRTISSAVASSNQDLTFIVEASGLAVGTAYWFDVQLSVGGVGTASIHVITCIIEEI